MSKFTVLSYPNNFALKKAQIAAEFGGLSGDFEYAKDFKMGVDNKTDAFLKISPVGKVPAIKIDGTETGLFESNAIARYTARVGNDTEGLLGKDALEQSTIDAWIDFVSYYISPESFALFAFAFGFGTYNEDKFNSAKAIQTTAWGHLEGHLNRNGNKYLVNDRITLADIVLFVTVAPLITVALDNDFRANYPKVDAYLHSLYENAHIKKYADQVKFVEKFTAPQAPQQ